MTTVRSKKTAAMFALAGVLSLGVAGLAYAASPHAISGTVYSPCSGYWYISSTTRYKEGYGDITAQFTVINSGGLTFTVIDQFNQQFGYQQSWAKTETNVSRTLASGVSDGKIFYNMFRQTSSDCNQRDYNFTGTETY